MLYLKFEKKKQKDWVYNKGGFTAGLRHVHR
jgi:hypothetical protein